MNIENQVCSIEQAKKLKELGVKQESIFYHAELYDNEPVEILTKNELVNKLVDFTIEKYKDEERDEDGFVQFSVDRDGLFKNIYENEFEIALEKSEDCIISAFTVAELGEMLPKEINFNKTQKAVIEFSKYGVFYGVSYRRSSSRQTLVCKDEKIEAQARAAMLIYLLENKLIIII